VAVVAFCVLAGRLAGGTPLLAWLLAAPWTRRPGAATPPRDARPGAFRAETLTGAPRPQGGPRLTH
jgi:hypothetical protein